MASFLSKLFGGGTGGSTAAIADSEEYGGCRIQPMAEKSEGQWRLAGTISKEINGEVVEKMFIRADLLTSQEDANAAAVRKAKQIIDERGDALFDPSAPDRV